VGSVLVVAVDEVDDEAPELLADPDDGSVEEFAADRSDPAPARSRVGLGVGGRGFVPPGWSKLRVGRPSRRRRTPVASRSRHTGPSGGHDFDQIIESDEVGGIAGVEPRTVGVRGGGYQQVEHS